jgi:phosphoribosyl-AMP cyclohydrolase
MTHNKMDNPKQHVERLLMKDSWSIEEKKWLLNYLETTEGKELEELLAQQYKHTGVSAEPDAEASKLMLVSIHEKLGIKKAPVIRIRKWRIAAAASLIGLIILTTYYLVYRGNKKEMVQHETPARKYKNDVPPGTNKAILTLADGSKVVLDDTQNGLVTTQGNSKIIKLGSKLSYEDSSSGPQKIVYNTIATPRAAQYQVELPDGSLVWLNAASSIRFPTAFTGGERRVEVTGEVYFEVVTRRLSSGQKMPFIVTVNKAEIQVLGTHFNVMAYSDEDAVSTTLLEGSVQFVSGQQKSLLQPGQQSQLTIDGAVKVIHDVNIDRVTAWKNGLFDFENATIETVMRQLSRWYDVDVIFKSHNNKDLFMLEMPRSSKLSDILKILELTGNIKFEIDGKKVFVFA